MKYKSLILIIIGIISAVKCEYNSQESNCVCVEAQHCHNTMLNLYGENVFEYKIGKCSESQECCSLSVEDMKPELRMVVPANKHDYTICGIHNFSVEAKGGTEALQGEFPWMAIVLENVENTPKYISGGSIIHPKVVLTTAHGLYDRKLKIYSNNLLVRVGSIDITAKVEYEVDVQKVIPHVNFVYKTSHNNIALLLLKKELILGPNVRTICLPPVSVTFDSKFCVISGFGDGDPNVLLLNQNLKKINLPLLKNFKCEGKFRDDSRITENFKLDDSLLCAGGIKGRDTCLGDGGSPLICSNKYYYQVGIVAYGFGCFLNHIPGVYTNVTHFYEWIVKTFAILELETKWFTPK